MIDRGLKLAADLRKLGCDVDAPVATLGRLASQADQSDNVATLDQQRELYLAAQQTIRTMALSNPLLDFDDLLLVKRVPGSFTHMSDQYYGWFSRPGGGLYVLKDFKSTIATPAVSHAKTSHGECLAS